MSGPKKKSWPQQRRAGGKPVGSDPTTGTIKRQLSKRNKGKTGGSARKVKK